MVTSKKINSKLKKLPQSDTEEELSEPSSEVVKSIVKGAVKGRKGAKQHEYFLYRFFGYPVNIAAELSGYHRGSGSRLEKKYRDNAVFRADIDRIASPAPGNYQTWARLRLPLASQIEDGAMQKMLDEPELAIRHPKLLRDLKQASGIDLGSETHKPAVQQVNIQLIQKHILNSIQQDSDSVEAEIIDIKIEGE